MGSQTLVQGAYGKAKPAAVTARCARVSKDRSKPKSGSDINLDGRSAAFMTTPEIFVSDILAAYDFYCEKLPFRCRSSEGLVAEDREFLIEGGDVLNNNRMRIKLGRDVNLLQGSGRDAGFKILEKIDVDSLIGHMRQNLPEFNMTGDWSEIPNGCFDGPHELPGGRVIYMRDPFGNLIWFAEW